VDQNSPTFSGVGSGQPCECRLPKRQHCNAPADHDPIVEKIPNSRPQAHADEIAGDAGIKSD